MQVRFVVVVAHPDDETLGAGGTIARFVAAGHEAHVLCLSNGVGARDDGDVDGRCAEFVAAMEILGVEHYEVGPFPDNQFDTRSRLELAQWVEHALAKIGDAHYLITHSMADLNVDHRRTHEAVLVATRPYVRNYMQTWACEVLSSTECGIRPFMPNVYVRFDGGALQKRDAALACYKSELRQLPHPRSAMGATSTMIRRGVECGSLGAEAFELIREVL